MKFTATHTRAFVGTDIALTVTADEKEGIAFVTVVLDDQSLEEIELASGTESYTRQFAEVGSSGPHAEHTLVVTATDENGMRHSATTRWTDL